MERILVILLVIAVGAVYVYNNKLDRTISPDQAADVVFLESRLKMTLKDRSIQLVVIGRGTKNLGCIESPINSHVQDMCKDKDVSCVATGVKCKKDVDNRYQRMLDKQKASTHYVHMENKNKSAAGVVLFWGLTDRESKTICDYLTQRLRSKPGPVETNCI